LPVAEIAALDGRGESQASLPDQALWDAVQELPTRQRSAVVLRYVADLPHRDIASAIGCSEEAARRSLHEGLIKLRKAVPT
jgi:RNA polymerase sigma factor (sigma-70 family)